MQTTFTLMFRFGVDSFFIWRNVAVVLVSLIYVFYDKSYSVLELLRIQP